MLRTLKNNWKRYVISSIVTFIATFLLAAIPELLDNNFKWTGPTVAGVVLAAVRLGVKAVWEILKPVLLNFKKQ